MSRFGKIARLPHNIRTQLNLRILDGETGADSVAWLNGLRPVQVALKRYFQSCPVTEQNLSEWRKRGYVEWLAKLEADAVLAETLKTSGKRRCRRGRAKAKNKEQESIIDRVAEWFFPHYVAAARGRVATARTASQRWTVLREVCGDLARFRRNENLLERLCLWRRKLEFDLSGSGARMTEEQFIKRVKTDPALVKKIWPGSGLSPEEKQARIKQILGITN